MVQVLLHLYPDLDSRLWAQLGAVYTFKTRGRIIWNLNSVQILSRASSSSQVKQKGQISLNSHEATSARYYTDRGNSKYSMQIPERVTFEFRHAWGAYTVSHAMQGRAINSICPRQLVGDIIEEISLPKHLVKYSSKRCIEKLSSDTDSQSIFHYPS